MGTVERAEQRQIANRIRLDRHRAVIDRGHDGTGEHILPRPREATRVEFRRAQFLANDVDRDFARQSHELTEQSSVARASELNDAAVDDSSLNPLLRQHHIRLRHAAGAQRLLPRDVRCLMGVGGLVDHEVRADGQHQPPVAQMQLTGDGQIATEVVVECRVGRNRGRPAHSAVGIACRQRPVAAGDFKRPAVEMRSLSRSHFHRQIDRSIWCRDLFATEVDRPRRPGRSDIEQFPHVVSCQPLLCQTAARLVVEALLFGELVAQPVQPRHRGPRAVDLQ